MGFIKNLNILFIISYVFFTGSSIIAIDAKVPDILVHEKFASIFSFAVGLFSLSSILASFVVMSFGRKFQSINLITFSTLIRFISLLIFLLSLSFPAFFILQIFFGFSSGLSNPSTRSIINHQTNEDNRSTVFKVFYMFMNLSYVLSPLMITIFDFYVMVIVFLCIEVFNLFTLSFYRGFFKDSGFSDISIKESILSLMRPQYTYLFISNFIVFFFIGYTLNLFILYDYVDKELGRYREYLISLEGIFVILCQIVLIKYSYKIFADSYIKPAVVLFMSIIMIVSGNLIIIVFGLLAFALSESDLLPKIQTDVVSVVETKIQRSFISALSITAMVGYMVGQLSVGSAIEYGNLIIVTYFSVFLLLFLFLLGNKKK